MAYSDRLTYTIATAVPSRVDICTDPSEVPATTDNDFSDMAARIYLLLLGRVCRREQQPIDGWRMSQLSEESAKLEPWGLCTTVQVTRKYVAMTRKSRLRGANISPDHSTT